MTSADRARQRELLWSDPPEAVRPPPWPDQAVRRVLPVAFLVARAALVDIRLELRAAHTAHRRAGVLGRGPGWLELADAPAVSTPAEYRVLGAVSLGRFGRAVPVELVLAPWSTTSSELRLQLRRVLNVPDRYFDVAHAVLDHLRDEIGARFDRRTSSITELCDA